MQRDRGAVEPAQRPVGGPIGIGKRARRYCGKLRVVRGGEAHAATQAVAPRGEAERTLGRDVQRLRRECADGALRPGWPGSSDSRISGYVGQATLRKSRGVSILHFVAEAAEPRGGLRQGAHDAVGLRKPRVGNDHDPHAASTFASRCDEQMNEGT